MVPEGLRTSLIERQRASIEDLGPFFEPDQRFHQCEPANAIHEFRIVARGAREFCKRGTHTRFIAMAFHFGDPARLPQLRTTAQRLAAASGTPSGSLHLQFQSVEHWMRPQILCVVPDAAIAEVGRASALATGIRQATLAAGFTPDLKPFHAHVTVARKVARAPCAPPLPRVTWNCDDFALVASTTSAAGSVYSVLESYPLDRVENARK